MVATGYAARSDARHEGLDGSALERCAETAAREDVSSCRAAPPRVRRGTMTDHQLTFYERIEIQMRYAVPLLRDLQRILGDDVVLDALRQRLDDRVAAAAASAAPPADLSERSARIVADFARFAAGGALEHADVPVDDAVGVDVTRCEYARLMESLDASDLGHLLICSEDHVMVAAGGVRLDRSQTLMQGATHCDFRFRPVDAAGAEPADDRPG